MVEYISFLLIVFITSLIIVTRASGIVIFLVTSFSYLTLYANNIIQNVITKFVLVSSFSQLITFIIFCSIILSSWFVTRKTIEKERLVENILPSFISAVLCTLITINETTYLPLARFVIMPQFLLTEIEVVLVGGLFLCLFSLWLFRRKPESHQKKHKH